MACLVKSRVVCSVRESHRAECSVGQFSFSRCLYLDCKSHWMETQICTLSNRIQLPALCFCLNFWFRFDQLATASNTSLINILCSARGTTSFLPLYTKPFFLLIQVIPYRPVRLQFYASFPSG